MIVILFAVLQFRPAVDLESLPSPSFVCGIISTRRSLVEYQRNLSLVETILVKYKQLTEHEKEDCIRFWFASIRDRHAKYVSQLKGQMFPIQISEEQAKVDLTKIDLLLLADERVPLFHTEKWMRNVFSLKKDISQFKINWPIRGYPNQIVTEYTGLPPEPGAASFEKFYAKETSKLCTWIVLKKHIKAEYTPMSDDRMYQKCMRPSS